MIHLKPRGREKIGELTRFQLIVCNLISQLDRIPRYGRLYVLRDTDGNPGSGKPEWRFMKNGLWGFYLLGDLGLIDAYLYHTNPGLLEYEMEQVRKFDEYESP